MTVTPALLHSISITGILHVFRVCVCAHHDRVHAYVCLRQRIVSNVCAAYVTDVDEDQRCELVVALTGLLLDDCLLTNTTISDRVLRTYRYVNTARSTKFTSLFAKDTTQRTAAGHLVAISKWETPEHITCVSTVQRHILMSQITPQCVSLHWAKHTAQPSIHVHAVQFGANGSYYYCSHN